MQWRLKRLRIRTEKMRQGVIPAESDSTHSDEFACWLAAYRGRLDQLRKDAKLDEPVKENHYAPCFDHKNS